MIGFGGGMRRRWRLTVRLAMAIAVLVSLLSFDRPTPAVAAIGRSFIFLTSLPGESIGQGRDYLETGVAYLQPATNRHRFTVQGSSTISIEVRAASGQLVPGTYWDLREPEYGEVKPGFRITVDGRTCATLGGGMIVDEATVDGAGRITNLALRFSYRCTGDTVARAAGTVAYEATRPVFARTLSPKQATATVAVGEMTTVPVEFTNTGPDPIGITGFTSVGARSGPGFAAWGGSRGTCPAVVGPGERCEVWLHLSGVTAGTWKQPFQVVDSLGANPPDGPFVLTVVGIEVTVSVTNSAPPTSPPPSTTAPPPSTSTPPPPTTPPTTSPTSTPPPPTPPSTTPATTTTTPPAPSVTATLPTVPTVPSPPTTAPDPLAEQLAALTTGGYVPAGPSRVLDTRNGTNAPRRRLAAGEALTFDVVGAGGLPRSGVRAVAVNVTATGAVDGGFLTVFPGGTDLPDSSNLNFRAGQDVANLVIVGVSDDGTITIADGPAATHVIVDLVGWYGDPPAGERADRQHAIEPYRFVDTRETTPLTGGETRSVVLAGRRGVPADATAVIVNLTATDVSDSTFLTLFPGGTDRPGTSSLNVQAGETRPNLTIVRLGPGGTASLYLDQGSANALIDVVGYFGSGGGGATFVGLEPFRVMNTREDGGPFEPDDLDVLWFGSELLGRRVAAVVLNVTVDAPDAAGFLTVFPGDVEELPNVSNLNFGAGTTVANLVVVKVPADGDVWLYEYGATTDVLVDLMGLVLE